MGHQIGDSLHEEPYLQMGLCNNEFLTNKKPLLEGFYAIEIYFSKDIDEERVCEIEDKKRSIYKKNNEYLPYAEVRLKNKKMDYDEIYSPIRYLGKIKNIFQIEETFLLKDKKLICISCIL
jgi:hypothetical protein